jgi:hypothetical protein
VITTLRIQNFKAFRDQTFELAPLTLLAGLNGSGKSSLLQALLVLRQSYDQRVLFPTAEGDPGPNGRIALNGGLVRIGRFQDVLFEGADEQRICISFVESTGVDYTCGFSATESDARTAIIDEMNYDPPRFVDFTLFHHGFRFLAAERIGPRTHYSIPDNEEGFVVSNRMESNTLSFHDDGVGVLGEWTPNYLARHGDSASPNPGSRHPGARSPELKHQVEAWMGEISTGIQIHCDRAESLDSVQMSYSFVSNRDTSPRYRPTNVGFGVSYTLPVVTVLLSAQPGDLLLLESPEAHLHPRGQAKLGELLSRTAASGVQIIVESHSDHVMNGIRVAAHRDILRAEDARFLYFHRDVSDRSGETKVESIQMDQYGRIDKWPPGFFDELDQSLETLLGPKGE